MFIALLHDILVKISLMVLEIIRIYNFKILNSNIQKGYAQSVFTEVQKH